MKTLRDLAAVGARLEEAAQQSLPESAHDPPAVYDHYEMIAILILDADAYEYPPGTLQGYLELYLADLRNKLGLSPR
jgi:hypothetical protein